MKKMLYFTFLILLVFVAACSDKTVTNDSETDVEKKEEETVTEEDTSENTEEEPDKSEEFSEETGEGFIDGLGYVKAVGVGYNEDLGIDGSDDPLKPIKMGSMELEIESLLILKVEPDEDARMLLFNDEEEVKAIVIEMKAENTEELDIEFYPDNAILTTDTGEQVESEIGLMEGVGGEFFGKVKKEGQTWWLLNDLDDDIKNVKMIISPPYDMEEWEDLAEEKRLEFDILTYEEALEKDMDVERD